MLKLAQFSPMAIFLTVLMMGASSVAVAGSFLCHETDTHELFLVNTEQGTIKQRGDSGGFTYLYAWNAQISNSRSREVLSWDQQHNQREDMWIRFIVKSAGDHVVSSMQRVSDNGIGTGDLHVSQCKVSN
jgi:hypothetical protein